MCGKAARVVQYLKKSLELVNICEPITTIQVSCL